MTSGPLLVGVDVGTTNVKAVAHRLDGTAAALASAPLVALRPRPGWEQFPAQNIDDAVRSALRSMMSDVTDPSSIIGVAVASMGETAVPLDRNHRAVHDALAWHDARGTDEAASFVEDVGRDALYRITGLPPRRIFGVYKLMWLREHEPEAFRRVWRWMNVSDYVAFRLCGEIAMDRSLASRLSLLDIRTGELSSELLLAAGIDPEILPPVVDAGTRLGTVTRDASRATGLPEGTVVSVGGHDHPCGALGIGLVRPGELLDSIGTAESVFAVTGAPALDDETAASGFEQGRYVVPGMTYAMGGVYTSGASVEWVLRLLGLEDSDRHTRLLELARQARPGSDGAMFLPYLRLAGPPVNDNRVRGAFVGLSDSHGRPELARSVLEGLVYEFVCSLRAMERVFDVQMSRIIAIGGGAANSLGLAVKRDLTGITIERSDAAEPGALGAAMLAGIGAGTFGGFEEAVGQMSARLETVASPPDAPEVHARAIELYRAIHPSLADLHHRIITHTAVDRPADEEL